METSEADVGAGGVAPGTRNPSLRTGRRRGLAGSEHGSCLPFSRRFEHEPCGRRPDSRSRGALTVAGLCRDLTGFATTQSWSGTVPRRAAGRPMRAWVAWSLAPGVVQLAAAFAVRGPPASRLLGSRRGCARRPRPQLGVGHDDVSLVMTASLISWLSEATWPSRGVPQRSDRASAARVRRFRARCGSRSRLDKTASHTEDPNDPFRVIPKTRMIRPARRAEPTPLIVGHESHECDRLRISPR